MRFADATRCLEVRSVGEVRFTDDDADVAHLAPGGSVTVEETTGGVTRRAEFTERGGAVARRFAVNGRPADDAEGAAWLRTVLPRVAREDATGAERRAARVLRQRGPRGVLDEVGEISSDRVKRIYLTALLAERRLTPAERREVAGVAGRALSSDTDKGAVLRAVVEQGGGQDVLRAVIDAASTISSDTEQGHVLAAAAAAPGAGTETRAAVAAAAGRGISSDRTKADVLAGLAPALGTGDDPAGATRAAYLAAARTLSSDTERRRVLLAALEPRAQGDALLAAPAARDAFFRAVDELSSDRDRGAVLRAVVTRDALPRPALLAALRSAGRTSSDRERADVLIAAAARGDALRDEEVRRTFIEISRQLSSSAEYRRVMDAVVR
jgi:hypothetical protein